MRSPQNSGTPIMLAIVAANVALIFAAAAFLKDKMPGVPVIMIAIVAAGGLLGFVILIMLTSKAKAVAQGILGIIIAAGIIFGAYVLRQHSNAQVMERHYAIVLTEMNGTDVKFEEYWFDSSLELQRFLSRNEWYMGKDPEAAKERREMLNYYYTVKAEEKEDKKELIKRYSLGSAPSQPAQGNIIAFVDEYRTGILAIESNPVYNVNAKTTTRDESEGDQ